MFKFLLRFNSNIFWIFHLRILWIGFLLGFVCLHYLWIFLKIKMFRFYIERLFCLEFHFGFCIINSTEFWLKNFWRIKYFIDIIEHFMRNMGCYWTDWFFFWKKSIDLTLKVWVGKFVFRRNSFFIFFRLFFSWLFFEISPKMGHKVKKE